MNEKPKDMQKPPGAPGALMRLLIITVVLFLLSWTINALLIGSWRVTTGGEESVRHFVEWVVTLIVAIVVVFLASLLPAFGAAHRFLNWLFSERIMRRLGVAAIWIITIVALFYVEEDWRGSRAWSNYRAQLEANGAQLDLAAFVPKPIPDEQNFAATPVVESWFTEVDKRIFTNTTERFVKNWRDNYELALLRITVPQDKTNRHFVDMVAWEEAFEAIRNGQTNSKTEFPAGKTDLSSRAAAAPAVLAGLKMNEAALAELQAASQRPLSRYPVIYNLDNPWGIFLPHLINVRDACRRLSFRACAELAGGRNDAALADVKLTLYVADSLKDEPFLISFLVRISCLQMAVQPVWEGLAEHAWTDAQLQELEARLQHYDLVADMKHPFEGELAAGVLTADLLSKKGLGLLIELIGPGNPTVVDKKLANWVGAILPRGWYHQEQVNYCRFYQKQLDGVFDPANKRISPGQMEINQQEITREMPTGSFWKTVGNLIHHRAIAALILPGENKIPVKTAAAQTALDQAALACALERYRFTTGNFPETLDTLEPKFIAQLPTDVIAGKPYGYERTSDGQFILTSAGQEGKVVNGKNVFDEKQTHWVWQYPEK